MKILHLCGGSLESGATRGALALHQSLLDLGVESSLIFSKGENTTNTQNASPFFKSPLTRQLFDKSLKWIEPAILKHEAKRKVRGLSIGMIGHPFLLKKDIIQAADVIHLHWINSRFLRIKVIQHFKKPIVWTMRDAWPYTGGCHYTNDCMRYRVGCGECPLVGTLDTKDRTNQVIQDKQNCLPRGIRYIALSNWTAEQARSSYLLKDESIEVIENCINELYLSPSDSTQTAAREQFNLPKDKVIILAGAVRIDSKYKGYTEVLPALSAPNASNIHLVTFGRISESLKNQITIPSTHLGSISSSQELKALYYAANLFIAPSTQEAFGKTLAEAGASGLPVICYDAGGPKDIVIHEVTGLKIPLNDTNTFAHATISLAQNREQQQRMGRAAIKHIANNFSPIIVAKKYMELYQRLEA
ncbi:MAG: glycosyltransferase [Opitutae bacterium]|nr:glycosyltransferase [Opitutae bacterium]